MLIELSETQMQELREYLVSRRDIMLAEIDHTDSFEFKRFLRGRYDRLEEILRALDAGLSQEAQGKTAPAL
jgi:hypothetical protein